MGHKIGDLSTFSDLEWLLVGKAIAKSGRCKIDCVNETQSLG